MDITEFIAARLDEDEAAAMAATPGPWAWDVSENDQEWTDQGPWLRSETATFSVDGRGPYPVTVLGAWGHDAWGVSVDDVDMAHIARHDPARALREAEAKRAHLAEYEGAVSGCLGWGITSVLESILYSDAAVWSDHPDYRAEWKPC